MVSASHPNAPGIARKTRIHPAVIRSVPLIVSVAAYHQWLGRLFSNSYFAGDAAAFIGNAIWTAINHPPGWLLPAYSKSPVTVALYAAMVKLLYPTLDSPLPYDRLPSDGYVAAFALLATLVCILTGLVAWRYTTSARVAAVALILSGLYAPFVIIGERGLSELPFMLLLLLVILSAREALARSSVGWGAVAGCCLALAIGARMQYLAPIMGCVTVALLAVVARAILRQRGTSRPLPATGREPRAPMRAARLPWLRRCRIPGAMCLALIACLALLLAYGVLAPQDHRFGGLVKDTYLYQSSFSYAPTDGWATDRFYNPLAPADAAPLKRDAAQLLRYRRPACLPGANQFVAFACLTLRYPGFALERAAVNEYRLWWFPGNDWQVKAGFVTTSLAPYHRFLLLAGIAGSVLLAFRSRWNLLLVTPAVFIAALFALEHIEVRYAIPAMPFLAIGAAALIVAILDTVTDGVRAARALAHRPHLSWRVVLPLLLFGAALLLVLGNRYLFMARGATRLAVLLSGVVPLAIIAACAASLLPRLMSGGRGARWVCGGLAALMLPVGVVPLATESSSDWSVTLTSADQQVIQKIMLPAAPSDGQQLAVLLDAEALDGDLADLMLTVNGHVFGANDPDHRAYPFLPFQPPWSYTWAYDQSHGARDPYRSPQWHAIPVPGAWLRAGENDIALALRPDVARPHRVRFFGQFSRATDHTLAMPSLTETSIFRYIFDGENRVRLPAPLVSDARYALYGEGGATRDDDLSPDPGIQRGTYHVFIGALTPAYEPDATNRSVNADIKAEIGTGSASGTSETVWFYATAPRNTRITLQDDSGTLIVFTAGQEAAQRWRSDEAEVAYVPAFRVGREATRLDPQAGALVGLAPGIIAVQRWYELYPERAGDGAVPPLYTGAYAIRLRHAMPAARLRFTVTPLYPALGGDWTTLMPNRDPRGDTLHKATVNVYLAGAAVENIGYAVPTAGGNETLAFFMLHDGDIAADRVVDRAVAMLGTTAPAARVLPTNATYVQIDEVPQGTLKSFWSSPDRDYGYDRASVQITLG